MKLSEIDANPILKKTLEFSIATVAYCELLEAARKYIVARQLLRSATSIGANAMEAQNAESKSDFIHRMKIAAKEASETQYWLLVCERSAGFPPSGSLHRALEEINRLLNSIIGTAKRKIQTPISPAIDNSDPLAIG